MKEILIAGAGLSGAVCARKLAEKGYKVVIHEQRPTIGGNAYDENINGVIVQKYGPHIFHTSSQEVMDFLKPYVKWVPYQHKVKGLVDGKLIPIPFNLTSLETLFDFDTATHVKNILFKEVGLGKKVPVMQLRKHKDKEVQKIGDFIYYKIFFNYTFKQWGTNPTKLNPQILERVPVNVSYQDTYFPDDTYQVMPEGGFTPIFEKLLNHPNIELHLNSNILDKLTFEIDGLYYENKLFTGNIIFTGCIDELFNYRLGKLPYRTLDFKFEEHKVTSYQEASVVNYPNNEEFTRISEFTKFTCSPVDDFTIIVKEYPREHQKDDIPYYPIENKNNLTLYERYSDFAKKYPNLHLLGRLANYKYINMDAAILNALRLSEKF